MIIRFTLVIVLLISIAVPCRSQFSLSSDYFQSNYNTFATCGLSTLSLADINGGNHFSEKLIYDGLSIRGTNAENLFTRGLKINGDSAGNSLNINYTRLAIVGGALVTTMGGIHLYMQNGWWKDNRAPFHFREDLIYGLSVDKIGHFYGADLLGYIFRKSLIWANMNEEQALWFGAGGGLVFQTFTEMEDGFSAWGFDRVDWLCNLGGALWAPAKYYIPFFRVIDIKMSYHPSDLLGNPGGIGFKGQKHIFIDDYEGQTFWLSIKVEDLLPNTVDTYWPDFLCLAVGYGARGVATPNPHRVYFIAPDIDFSRLIPQSTFFLKTLSEVLNYIHLPLPAIRVYPTSILYGIYF